MEIETRGSRLMPLLVRDINHKFSSHDKASAGKKGQVTAFVVILCGDTGLKRITSCTLKPCRQNSFPTLPKDETEIA